MDETGANGLADKACVPCRGDVPPLKGKELKKFSAQLPDWKVVEELYIQKVFLFSDFRKALDFVNVVGQIAEEQGHHPDLLLSWGKVEAKINTHKVNGLTESDFFLAAKIDRAYQQ